MKFATSVNQKEKNSFYGIITIIFSLGTNVLTPGKTRYQGNKNWNRLMYAIFTGPL